MAKEVLFLVAPTGSGKTQLSLDLARRLGLEIVSADSMLVYRGMDIGTAKPTRAERQRIRHHLIDLVSPPANFSVHRHRRQALKAIQQIVARGGTPLVVAGGGLYLDALWKGLSDPPGGSVRIRRGFEREADEKGLASLHEKLRKLDPVRARAIHPNDRRRIIRAFEIASLSGKRPSEWRARRGGLEDLGYRVRVFGIRRERTDLYDRINHRVESMFRKGFLAEVKRLGRRGFSKTAAQALGYREILNALAQKNRPVSRAELVRLIQKRTRQFAKRQLTWFRREKAVSWIDCRKDESMRSVCDKILIRIHGKE